MPLVLFGGLFSNMKDIPVFLTWIPYFSPVRYAYELIVRNEFDGSGVNPDPIETYSLKFGMTACIIGLACITVGLRIMAVTALKLLERRVE